MSILAKSSHSAPVMRAIVVALAALAVLAELLELSSRPPAAWAELWELLSRPPAAWAALVVFELKCC